VSDTNGKLIRLWETKNKNDEWWSSFVTSPLAILLNWVVVDIRWITPNLLTLISFLVALLASAMIFEGSRSNFLIAALLINASLVIDCMDGQMAKYRGVSSRFGSYFDKVTDQIKIFVWFSALAYTAYQDSQSIVPVFLAFTGVTFYSLRVYVKYVTIFVEVEHDEAYLAKSSREAADVNDWRSRLGGIDQSLWQNLHWFLREQKKFFLFNESVFVFILSVALIFDQMLPVLWLFALSQLYFGIVRSWQRGSQIHNNQHNELLKPIEK
jgi:phosphatidylglycerophosphate synthase